ncbi:NmrA family NAD(P)-binding protein [Haloarculaceae archaeon H-GB2-1]|nr:NmrA family NAD(P)-binding protein [Haloarculaceae archaeon H-GB2-1]
MTSDRVLVTGATGRVGGPLVTDLLERSVTVRIASRDPTGARERFGETAEYVEFDLERPETWGAALADVDGLFLLFPPSVGVRPVREFVDAAERVGVDRIGYLSILGAEKLPILPPRRIENHIARTDLAATFLRASYFMQNLSGIHRPEIVGRDELFVPAGDGSLSFVDARDVAAVAATALTEPGHRNRAYDLTGPAALDFHEVAEVFSEVLARPITYADPSRLAFARHMYRRGVPHSLVAFMTVEYSVVRLGFSGRTTGDVEAVLGRPPRSLREFVSDEAETFQRDRERPTSTGVTHS